MRLKSLIERPLRRAPWLHRLCSKLYYHLDRRFLALSPQSPTVLRRAFDRYRQCCDTQPRDYYEFGLFRGASFLTAQRVCDDLGLDDVRFYGFDSFQGLPKVEGVDRENNQFFEGQFATSRTAVEEALEQRGFDWSRAALIEGYYHESLTKQLCTRHPFRKVAVALIDCDLYTSTRDVLAWLYNYLAPGSVLLFDDWRSFGDNAQLGQQKALGEFLGIHPGLRVERLWSFPNHGEAMAVTTVDDGHSAA